MDNYGLNMQGSFLIQKVDDKPVWTVVDMGRLIFEVNTGQYWLGGDSTDDGDNGWIPIGLIEGTVKVKHINWDTLLSGDIDKVSAKDIPCLYDTTNIINVQDSITNILNLINQLSTGELLLDNVISVNNLNFTASSFPIDNNEGTFSGPAATVESALEEIAAYYASDWRLDPNDNFGQYLPFTSTTIQQALNDLEEYVSSLNGSSISVTYAGTGSPSSLQGTLDAMYYQFDNIEFIDLVGTPNNYGVINQYLRSTGSGLEWVSLNANNTYCQYPGTVDSTVQAAIWIIQGQLTTLESSLLNVTAESQNVSYDNPTYSNVDDALDFLLAHSYTASNPPNAVSVLSSGVGGADNVQESLEYLQTQVNQILALVPVSVDANDVTYNAPSGHTYVDGTLDYIYSELTEIHTELDLKASTDHDHPDLYYLKDDINTMIPANFDEFYYRKDEVDELAAQTIQSIFNCETSPISVDESLTQLVICNYTAIATEELAVIYAFKVISPTVGNVSVRLTRDDVVLVDSAAVTLIDTDYGKTYSATVPDSVSVGDHTFKITAQMTEGGEIAVEDISILIHRVTNGG